MNTYTEHQVRPMSLLTRRPRLWRRFKLMSLCHRWSSIQIRPPSPWDFRTRTSWITWSATSTTLSSGSSTTPFMRKHHWASLPAASCQVFGCVCVCWTVWWRSLLTVTGPGSAEQIWQLHFGGQHFMYSYAAPASVQTTSESQLRLTPNNCWGWISRLTLSGPLHDSSLCVVGSFYIQYIFIFS